MYDYYPLAVSLFAQHLSPQAQAQRHAPPRGGNLQLVPEKVLWSYAIQLASAIKAAHNADLAVRTIDLRKILLTGKNRLRVGGCGMLDVMRNDLAQDGVLQHLQVSVTLSLQPHAWL